MEPSEEGLKSLHGITKLDDQENLQNNESLELPNVAENLQKSAIDFPDGGINLPKNSLTLPYELTNLHNGRADTKTVVPVEIPQGDPEGTMTKLLIGPATIDDKNPIEKHIEKEVIIDDRVQEYNMFGQPLPKRARKLPANYKREVMHPPRRVIAPARRIPEYIPDVNGNMWKVWPYPMVIELSTEYETEEDPDESKDATEAEEVPMLSKIMDWLSFGVSDVWEFIKIIQNAIVSAYTSVRKDIRMLMQLFKDDDDDVDGVLDNKRSRLIWK